MKKECNNNINCNVCNCAFHKDDCTCTADAIKVGAENAYCCDDTRCATFKLKGDNDDPSIYSPLV